MEINEIIAAVTEGLPAEQAAIVKAAIERDAVKSKAASWKQQSDLDAIQAQAQNLQRELDGETGKPGTRAYATWYKENYPAVQALQAKMKAYEDKYGSLDASATPTTPTQPTATFTKEDVQRMVTEVVGAQYSPMWSNLVTGAGKIVQKHMFAGRKSPIDMDEVSKIASTKYQGNLEAAYDEWDKPERDKADAAEREKEIKRRVDEEMAKRSSASNFPSGADMTPGSLSSRTKGELDKFDKVALSRELAQGWNNIGTDVH